MHSIRVIKLVRSAYNRYIASVLAAASQRVEDARKDLNKAYDEQNAIHAALFHPEDAAK